MKMNHTENVGIVLGMLEILKPTIPPIEAPMNEARAREILEDAIEPKSDGLQSLIWYLAWKPKEGSACLDGDFTADDLEAIAWWMRNKGHNL